MDDVYGFPDRERAARIAKDVRGDGLFDVKTDLVDACVHWNADCTLMLPSSACIEWQVRRDNFWVIRNEGAGEGLPPNKVRVRGDILDAWSMCQALAETGEVYNYDAPPENSGNEGGQGGITGPLDMTASFDPKLVFGAGLLAIVGAVAWAKFRS